MELFMQSQAAFRNKFLHYSTVEVLSWRWTKIRRQTESCRFRTEGLSLQWYATTSHGFICEVLILVVTETKGFSIQCYCSPSTSRKQSHTANSFNISCLKLKYLGHNMVFSWSLFHLLEYINWCKLLQFLIWFARKALHRQKRGV